MRDEFRNNDTNYRRDKIDMSTCVGTFILLLLRSDALQEARQIIILQGMVATRALVRVDGKSYYEIIINGIMSEVTRYVFE